MTAFVISKFVQPYSFRKRLLSSCSTRVACNILVVPHSSLISFLSPMIPLISHSYQEWMVSAGHGFSQCCRSLWSCSFTGRAGRQEAIIKKESNPTLTKGEGTAAAMDRDATSEGNYISNHTSIVTADDQRICRLYGCSCIPEIKEPHI